MTIRSLYAIVLLGVSCFSSAQTPKEQAIIEARIRLNCLEIVDQLNKEIVLDAYDRQLFLRLFENESVLIQNDIMPHNEVDQQVSVREYLDLIPTYFDMPWYVEVIPYSCQIENIDGRNTGIVVVNALKLIESQTSTDKGKVMYIDTFDIKVEMEFDYRNKQYRITQISSNKVMGKYVVVECGTKALLSRRKLSRNDSVEVNRQLKELDRKGRVVLKGIGTGKRIVVTPLKDDLIGGFNKNFDRIKPILESDTSRIDNILRITFRKIKFYIQPGFSYAVNQAPLSSTSSLNLTSSKNRSYAMAIGLGWRFISTPKFQVSLESGIRYHRFSYNLSMAGGSYSYDTLDADNYPYERQVKWGDVSESNSLQLLTIPAQLNVGFHFSKWTPFITAGIEIPISMEGTYSSEGTFTYQGYYPDLFNLRIDQKGVYDFGEYPVPGDGDLGGWTNTYLLNVGIGSEYRLSQRSRLVCSLVYRQSLAPVFSGSSPLISSDNSPLQSITQLDAEFKWQTTHISASYKYYF